MTLCTLLLHRVAVVREWQKLLVHMTFLQGEFSCLALSDSLLVIYLMHVYIYINNGEKQLCTRLLFKCSFLHPVLPTFVHREPGNSCCIIFQMWKVCIPFFFISSDLSSTFFHFLCCHKLILHFCVCLQKQLTFYSVTFQKLFSHFCTLHKNELVDEHASVVFSFMPLQKSH